MKGYTTSTDYELLWKLIQDGYRVPGWATEPDDLTFDTLVECKIIQNHPGFYGMFLPISRYDEEGFRKTCSEYKLRFIAPGQEMKLVL